MACEVLYINAHEWLISMEINRSASIKSRVREFVNGKFLTGVNIVVDGDFVNVTMEESMFRCDTFSLRRKISEGDGAYIVIPGQADQYFSDENEMNRILRWIFDKSFMSVNNIRIINTWAKTTVAGNSDIVVGDPFETKWETNDVWCITVDMPKSKWIQIIAKFFDKHGDIQPARIFVFGEEKNENHTFDDQVQLEAYLREIFQPPDDAMVVDRPVSRQRDEDISDVNPTEMSKDQMAKQRIDDDVKYDLKLGKISHSESDLLARVVRNLRFLQVIPRTRSTQNIDVQGKILQHIRKIVEAEFNDRTFSEQARQPTEGEHARNDAMFKTVMNRYNDEQTRIIAQLITSLKGVDMFDHFTASENIYDHYTAAEHTEKFMEFIKEIITNKRGQTISNNAWALMDRLIDIISSTH